MSREQWLAIHMAAVGARNASSCCLASCYVFVCCCKDQVEMNVMISRGGLAKRLQGVNTSHFGDSPVAIIRANQVIVQSNYLTSLGSQPQHAMAHQPSSFPEVEAVPIGSAVLYGDGSGKEIGSSGEGLYQHQYQPVPQPPHEENAVPPPPPSPPMRKMDVIVPEGAPPGSILSVQDPHGQVVQVTVPMGVTPGMKLEFCY